MSDYFRVTYGGKEELFFAKTLFVCDLQGKPIATCLSWQAYDEFNTIQWFKVLKECEGQGVGTLLSIIMRKLERQDYPVYLHTQPSSFRAIKLYSDFGFSLLSNDSFGMRKNELEECMPILEKFMPKELFEDLRITSAPKAFVDVLEKQSTNQF